MPVRIETSDKTVTARLEGEIDHHTAKPMREAIDSAVIRLRPEVLRLDFSAVGFMDSSGVGLIMGRYRLLSGTGGSVEITGASAGAQRMLRMAGLSRLGIKGIN